MSGGAVYTAISAVMAVMAKEGISKDRRSGDGGGPKFAFRGIDDVYNALAPVMAENKLMMLPRMQERSVVERTTKNGGAMFYTTVTAEFDIVSAEDGSKHTVRTFGEAMDASDKSTNKAMSAAFKYAAMQAFCIPTEGDNDADAQTHEIQPQQQREHPRQDRQRGGNGGGEKRQQSPDRAMIDWVDKMKARLATFDGAPSFNAFADLTNDDEFKRRQKAITDANPALGAELAAAIAEAGTRTDDVPF